MKNIKEYLTQSERLSSELVTILNHKFNPEEPVVFDWPRGSKTLSVKMFLVEDLAPEDPFRRLTYIHMQGEDGDFRYGPMRILFSFVEKYDIDHFDLARFYKDTLILNKVEFWSPDE